MHYMPQLRDKQFPFGVQGLAQQGHRQNRFSQWVCGPGAKHGVLRGFEGLFRCRYLCLGVDYGYSVWRKEGVRYGI